MVFLRRAKAVPSRCRHGFIPSLILLQVGPRSTFRLHSILCSFDFLYLTNKIVYKGNGSLGVPVYAILFKSGGLLWSVADLLIGGDREVSIWINSKLI